MPAPNGLTWPLDRRSLPTAEPHLVDAELLNELTDCVVEGESRAAR
ncbi:hypothetical protein OG930_23435 [Streptomyces sp. NBC_01799]|nr:hypothetical protein [Streptomyces sp. NBC_01800]WSA69802.1 hypothetical protein OIE65_24140 [Streptomyces sp. NBC_01800]WSA78288.1 hypothetical protein OG930_23435 [Streptomyces sp. NBC_01799]